MDKQAPPEVLAIGEINFTGNVTPHTWYEHLRYNSGKPNLSAITILGEIVYWYRPVEVRDETTGELLGYKKKFKGDKLQRSYASFANQFGLTKKQARDAISFLVSKDLVTKELRTIQTEGMTLSNVLFIGINPQRISEINTPSDTQVTPMTSKSHPINIEVIPSIPESQTYTETTTKIESNINNAGTHADTNGQADTPVPTHEDVDPLGHVFELNGSHNPQAAVPSDFQQYFGTRDKFMSIWVKKMGDYPADDLKEEIIRLGNQEDASPENWRRAIKETNLNFSGNGRPPPIRYIQVYEHGGGDYQKFTQWMIYTGRWQANGGGQNASTGRNSTGKRQVNGQTADTTSEQTAAYIRNNRENLERKLQRLSRR
jgi:hypothetical protein